ncbi:hypothetical protein HDV06_006299 [Boothiomyces sp. JEL0866]|nr:hypothetical protein HDV06_006299 [Boothiomyces sp. JEL0866]
MSNKSGGKSVFVGNIPYDMTETQLTEIFSEVGQVLNMRFVFDKETGKPKGFGFCTFQDAETAASAIRNLNKYDINGRQLKVAYADNDNDAPVKREESLDVPAVIKSISPMEIASILANLKGMIQKDPNQATALLASDPPLAFAVFQALLTMNLVDQQSRQKILQTKFPTTSTYQSPVQPMAVPVMQPPMVPMQPVAMPYAQPVNPLQAQQLQDQQQQLFLQIVNLTPEQIQAFSPDERHKILQLRAQLLGGGAPQ